MASRLIVENLFTTSLLNDIASSGDVVLNVPIIPKNSKGWISISSEFINQNEVCFYHATGSWKIYVRGINRINPKAHSVGETIKINDVAELFNTIFSYTPQMFFVEKTGNLSATVWWGFVLINGDMVEVPDVNLSFGTNKTTYINFDPQSRVISTSYNKTNKTRAVVVTSSDRIISTEQIVASEEFADFSALATKSELATAISNSNNLYTKKSENLNDLTDKGIARNNISVYSKAESDSKNTEQDGRLKNIEDKNTSQDAEINSIKVKNTEQDGRLTSIETKNIEQDGRLKNVEDKNIAQDTRLTKNESDILTNNNDIVSIKSKNTEQDGRLTNIESKNAEQDTRLTNAESKNATQDTRLTDVEAKNISQDNAIASKANSVHNHTSGSITDFFSSVVTVIRQSVLPGQNISITNEGENQIRITAAGGQSGGGDMLKYVYDTDNDGKVDTAKDAEKLGGLTPDAYVKTAELPKVIDVNIATAANMQQKIGTTENGNYSPQKGDELLLIFEKGSTSSNCLLNIDNSGSKEMKIGASNVTWTTLNLPVNSKAYVRAYYDWENYQIYGSTANHTYQTISSAEALNASNNMERLVSGEMLGLIRNRANHTGTQAIDTVEGLQGVLNGKAPNIHTHTKQDIGLWNVDNTSDINKPVSTAVQNKLNDKANTTHMHDVNSITGLSALLASKADWSYVNWLKWRKVIFDSWPIGNWIAYITHNLGLTQEDFYAGKYMVFRMERYQTTRIKHDHSHYYQWSNANSTTYGLVYLHTNTVTVAASEWYLVRVLILENF